MIGDGSMILPHFQLQMQGLPSVTERSLPGRSQILPLPQKTCVES